MTSAYRFHESVGERVPWQAKYLYPTQANRAWKTSVKIPPTNGSNFSSDNYGTSIEIRLPAQGYLDPANTTLSFDLEIEVIDKDVVNVAMQNNIMSVFERARLNYGSLTIEDLRKINLLSRMLGEAVGTNQNTSIDQNAITEGIGGTMISMGDLYPVVMNTRLNAIQSGNFKTGDTLKPYQGGAINSTNINDVKVTHKRRYNLLLNFGLFTQPHLIPLKWMASQLSIFLDLATPADCMVQDSNSLSTPGAKFKLSNVFLNAQLLEFDGTYDAAFLEGLRGDGVPIKFSSWDCFQTQVSPSAAQTLLVPERNRSLKSIYTVQVPPRSPNIDSHAMVQSSTKESTYSGQAGDSLVTTTGVVTKLGGATEAARFGHVKDFQFRIGGKYWPSTPVQCGEQYSNGAAEAFVEFQKALNTLGDFRSATSINPNRWSMKGLNRPETISILADWAGNDANNIPSHIYRTHGPSCFVIAAALETSAGDELSGLNGEEQNDIALMINYSHPQDPSFSYYTFVNYDCLLVLRENNLVELIK